MLLRVQNVHPDVTVLKLAQSVHLLVLNVLREKHLKVLVSLVICVTKVHILLISIASTVQFPNIKIRLDKRHPSSAKIVSQILSLFFIVVAIFFLNKLLTFSRFFPFFFSFQLSISVPNTLRYTYWILL